MCPPPTIGSREISRGSVNRATRAEVSRRVLRDAARGQGLLDFGCGTGRPIAQHLLARGYRVTGVDGSAGMLALARQFVPQAQLVQARLEDVELTDTFAAAIAWDSLFHVDRVHHAAIYTKCRPLLMPGGRLLLTRRGIGRCRIHRHDAW